MGLLNGRAIATFAFAAVAAWAGVSMDASKSPALGAVAAGPACFEAEGDRGWPVIDCIGADTFDADVCAAIARNAERWRLPPDFLARLIWQESRFDPSAISPAGARLTKPTMTRAGVPAITSSAIQTTQKMIV